MYNKQLLFFVKEKERKSEEPWTEGHLSFLFAQQLSATNLTAQWSFVLLNAFKW